MNSKISGLLNNHTILVKHIFELSESILVYSKENDLKKIDEKDQIRSKVINILCVLHKEIEILIEKIDPIKENDTVQRISNWRKSTNELLKKIEDIDQLIISHLEEQKNQASKEISAVYTNKKKINGYNLNNLKP